MRKYELNCIGVLSEVCNAELHAFFTCSGASTLYTPFLIFGYASFAYQLFDLVSRLMIPTFNSFAGELSYFVEIIERRFLFV